MARTRIYVGRRTGGAPAAIFRASDTPTSDTHGDRYAAVIGPFASMAGARIMVAHGGNNPHIQSSTDADRMAKTHSCAACINDLIRRPAGGSSDHRPSARGILVF